MRLGPRARCSIRSTSDSSLPAGPQARSPQATRLEVANRKPRARRSTHDEANRIEEVQPRYGAGDGHAGVATLAIEGEFKGSFDRLCPSATNATLTVERRPLVVLGAVGAHVRRHRLHAVGRTRQLGEQLGHLAVEPLGDVAVAGEQRIGGVVEEARVAVQVLRECRQVAVELDLEQVAERRAVRGAAAVTATLRSVRIRSCCRHSRRNMRRAQRTTARRAATPPLLGPPRAAR